MAQMQAATLAERERKHVSALVRAGDQRRLTTAAITIQRRWRQFQQRTLQSTYMHEQRGWQRERQQMTAEQHRAAAQTGRALVQSTVKQVEVRAWKPWRLMHRLQHGLCELCTCVNRERKVSAVQETMNLMLMEMLLPKKVKQKVYAAQVQAGLQPRGTAGSKTTELLSPRVPTATPPTSHGTTRRLAALLPGRPATPNGHVV